MVQIDNTTQQTIIIIIAVLFAAYMVWLGWSTDDILTMIKGLGPAILIILAAIKDAPDYSSLINKINPPKQ